MPAVAAAASLPARQSHCHKTSCHRTHPMPSAAPPTPFKPHQDGLVLPSAGLVLPSAVSTLATAQGVSRCHNTQRALKAIDNPTRTWRDRLHRQFRGGGVLAQIRWVWCAFAAVFHMNGKGDQGLRLARDRTTCYWCCQPNGAVAVHSGALRKLTSVTFLTQSQVIASVTTSVTGASEPPAAAGRACAAKRRFNSGTSSGFRPV